MWKQTVGMSVLLGLALFLLPLFSAPEVQQEEQQPPPGNTETKELPEVSGMDETVSLCVEIGGTVQELTLKEYLIGVVQAEMPAAFELEALKAQMVAARTYTLYQMAHGSSGKHESGADLCDQPSCCQAYLDAAQAAANWGENAQFYGEKLAAAQQETDGLAVLYQGEPILAVFHSSSADATEDAAAAWSSSVPYLQSVESPESAADVPNYQSKAVFTEEAFRALFLAEYPNAVLSGSASEWFHNIQRDAAGYVSTLTVGGVTLRGVELRSLLSLRSACFTIGTDAGQVTFSTSGYGHGVGMSQYGANALAKQGKSCEEILRWYYTDVEVEPYSG